MAIRVDTTAYQVSHGRKPRGWGLWMFTAESRMFQVTDYYRNAVAEAKRQVRRDCKVQDGTLIVMP